MRSAALALAILSASPVAAWNKAGHMVSGAIAAADLRAADPAAFAEVVRLLKAHPQFAERWERRLDGAPDDDRDLMLFMLAARWADDIRGDPAHHRSKWHYINLPFVPPGQPDSLAPPPPDSDNILRAFELNLGIVSRPSSTDEEKAIALCWLFHLVGDAHQPLHVVSLFTTEFPRGDRGGNAFQIRAKPDAAVISLHKFWDDLIIGTENARSTRNRAIELRLRPEHARGQLPELQHRQFEHWLKRESFRLAQDVVYRNGRLPGSADAATAPTLPSDYIPQAKAVAERQIVLAGYRLADVLRQAVSKPPATKSSSDWR
jgi:hypothetical protein